VLLLPFQLIQLDHSNRLGGKAGPFLHHAACCCVGLFTRSSQPTDSEHSRSRSFFIFVYQDFGLLVFHVPLIISILTGQGILHRDLKPGNVLLIQTGFIKLTGQSLHFSFVFPRLRSPPPSCRMVKCIADMGICGHLKKGVCLDGSGTVGYMCPQRHTGDGAHGTPSDWFSLGVMLHQLLCKVISPILTTLSVPSSLWIPFIYYFPSLWITMLFSKNRPFKTTDFSEKARHEIREGKMPFPTPVIEPALKKKCSVAFLDLLSGLMKVEE
jgi:serine/threonine protein kinase